MLMLVVISYKGGRQLNGWQFERGCWSFFLLKEITEEAIRKENQEKECLNEGFVSFLIPYMSIRQ